MPVCLSNGQWEARSLTGAHSSLGSRRTCSWDLEGPPRPPETSRCLRRGQPVTVLSSVSFPQLLEFDKELCVFKDRLYELDISFPPR